MAQAGIREYDGKKMFFQSIGEKYNGIQLVKASDISKLSKEGTYVIKPDMLFGKRGKRGLLGINLDYTGINQWYIEKNNLLTDIDGVSGKLDTFLVEPFTQLKEEYYISFSQGRNGDTVFFSTSGGIDIEEDWDKVQEINISPSGDLSIEQLVSMGVIHNSVADKILQLWNFYRNHGFVYLEVNPLGVDTEGNIQIIDMVAKVDTCEQFRQKNNWGTLEIPGTFGWIKNEAELKIADLDASTGASMKYRVLNKDARIWTLLAGGGGSLVMTDTIGSLGFYKEIGNYGELSGNPDKENTREYTRIVLREMLQSSAEGKILIIAGAIANFTQIDVSFQGMIEALQENIDELNKQGVKILIRRGGAGEKKGLRLMKEFSEASGVPITISGSNEYMTKILEEITL